jgi:uncharacterized membrane protein YdjX (TVP38/TMEM64 family)
MESGKGNMGNLFSWLRKRFTRVHGAVLAAVIIILMLIWLLPVRHYLLGFLEWSKGMGLKGSLLVILCYTISGVLLVPASILALGTGFVFGLTAGTLTASIGGILGAVSAFLAGRIFVRQWLLRRMAGHPKFLAIDGAIGSQGFRIVFLSRLSPILPFNILNYAYGATKVSLKDYFVASWIGMLPETFMYVYLGSGARSLTQVATGQVTRGAPQEVMFWVGLAATLLVIITVTRITRRALQQTMSEHSEEP